MTDLITRCPKCKTSFRVNDEHLNTARGAVRCGSCLNIFNAKENLLQDVLAKENGIDESSFSPKPIEEKAPAQDQRPPTEKDPDDDKLISDDMDDEEETLETSQIHLDESLDSNIFVAKSASKTEINLFERRIKDAEKHDNEHIEADESWALNLLEEDSDEDQSQARNQAFSLETSTDSTDDQSEQLSDQGEADLAEHTENELELGDHLDDHFKQQVEPQNSEPESKYNSPFQFIEDAPSERAQTPETTESGLEPFPEELLLDPSETTSSNSSDASQDNHSYDKSIFEEEQAFEEEPFETQHDTSIFSSIEPEPLELHVKHRAPIWQRGYFWLVLNVLAALVLTAQIAYFKFEDWGRQESLRPYYAFACDVLGCSLPVLQDLSKIKVDSMVVMDHPKNEGMLLVDATLQNRAKFDQHFPTLLLTFTDLDNTLVKELKFTREHYVGGELAGKRLMPARHPIRITLEVDDPGADALNYQIAIVKP